MNYPQNYNDLYAFLMVANEKNFTKAARLLGVSQPALSKTIRQLEQRLGLTLLTRTTRSLSLTQAGEQLYQTVQFGFTELNDGLTRLNYLKDTPSGKVRINASLHAIDKIILPKLAHFSQQFPEIQFELISENRFVDIVAEQFDAGIRLGDDVQEGMIAVKIYPPTPMAVVGTPEYFERFNIPKTVAELTHHHCIAYKYQSGGVYAWQFWQDGQVIKHKPNGQWIVQDSYLEVSAVRLGLGLAYVPMDLVADDVATGRLIRVLQEFSDSLPAVYLYYPHRQVSVALKAVIEYLKI